MVSDVQDTRNEWSRTKRAQIDFHVRIICVNEDKAALWTVQRFLCKRRNGPTEVKGHGGEGDAFVG